MRGAMGFGTSEGEHCGGVRYLEYLKKGDSKKGKCITFVL